MRVFVECKADETTVIALGASPQQVEHATGRGGVCGRLSRLRGVVGMVDEDPGAARPSYMKALVEKNWQHEVRLMSDTDRDNRVIIVCPRLEDWIVASAKDAGLRMTEFGFESDNGIRLHSEINQKLGSLERLVKTLLSSNNRRILRLQSLLLGKF